MIETRRLIELKLVCRGVGSLVAIVPIPFLARISNNRRITPTIVRSAREAGIEIFQMPRVPTETLYADVSMREKNIPGYSWSGLSTSSLGTGGQKEGRNVCVCEQGTSRIRIISLPDSVYIRGKKGGTKQRSFLDFL